MKNLISKIDITLEINPKMRGIFPNENHLSIPFVAGQPTPVPDYVAKYYTKNKPHVFSLTPDSIEEKPKEMYQVETQNEDVQNSADPAASNPIDEEFNPEQFLIDNYRDISQPVKELPRKDLIKLVKFMKLVKNATIVSSPDLQEKIIHDVAVRIRQEDELNKHKDAINE